MSEADIYNDLDTSSPIVQTLENKRGVLRTVISKSNIGNEIVGSVRSYQKEDMVHIKRLIVNPNYQK